MNAPEATPVEQPGRRSPANRPGLDYRAEAHRLGAPRLPIIDAHIHVLGTRAVAILKDAARRFGVSRLYSQTRLAEADSIRAVLGDMVRFVAVPNWGSTDRARAFRQGFIEDLATWHEAHGARIVKFWAAPRLWDMLGPDAADAAPLDSPWRVRAAEEAMARRMIFMCHVADPDTWFATKYADAARYGRKRDHHLALERMLDRFPAPWIAAHMGGSPENLDVLDGLLARHDNLYLDTSATKWQVRELSKHPRERVLEFFTRWRGRILFGSDIVTTDEHLAPKPAGAVHPMGDLADSPESAFDLYASRYYALRTMFEGSGDHESPIADPDLALVEPARFDAMSAPVLRGFAFPAPLLDELYTGASTRLLGGA